MKRNSIWSDVRIRFAGTAAGLLLLSGCSLPLGASPPEPPPSAAPSQPQLKTVRVEEVAVRDIGNPLDAAAELTATDQVRITIRQAGEVAQVFKRNGEAVQEGEIIVRLHAEELNRHRAKAVTALQSAQAKLANAGKESSASAAQYKQLVEAAVTSWNQARNNYDLGLIGQAELDRVQAELTRIRSESERAAQQHSAAIAAYRAEVQNASLALAEIDQALSELEVKAPASGIYAGEPLKEGMLLGAGAEIGAIHIVDTVRIVTHLSSELVKFTRDKTELPVYAGDHGKAYKAAIVSLKETAGALKPTYELILEAENPGWELKPGMNARVRLTEDQEQLVTAVPTKAILYEDGVPYVFVAEGNMVSKRKIELGRVNEPYQEVLSGVQEKEWLVVTNLSQLEDREQVQIQRQEGDQP